MEIIVEQADTGQRAEITKKYNVVEVTGLTPATATINTTSNGIADGTFFNSAYLDEKTIEITLVPDGDIEQKRLELYKIFRPKQAVILHISTSSRKAYIQAYPEDVSIDLYSVRQSLVVSLKAPQPLFISEDETQYTQTATIAGLEFPVEIPEIGIEVGEITKERDITILSQGEDSSGIILELIARDIVVNPTIYQKNANIKFALRTEMQKGDIITINTMVGQKKIIRNRGGKEENLLNSIVKGSKWLTIEPGNNIYTYICEKGEQNLTINYNYRELYGGF